MSKPDVSAAAQKSDVFQAIADPTRRSLLQLLDNKEMPVTAISNHYPISRTAVSKHLRILTDAGLLKERKIGRETRYRLDPEPLLELKRWLSYYERYWENKISALKRFVEADEEDEGSEANNSPSSSPRTVPPPRPDIAREET